MFLEGDNVFRVEVAFSDAAGEYAWQLGIWNNDTATAGISQNQAANFGVAAGTVVTVAGAILIVANGNSRQSANSSNSSVGLVALGAAHGTASANSTTKAAIGSSAQVHAGSVKVNRHVFWLTEEHRAPRIFGFFPIMLLGAQFLMLFALHTASKISLDWIGFGCVLTAIPILLTADTCGLPRTS